jgi:hypothetical protein
VSIVKQKQQKSAQSGAAALLSTVFAKKLLTIRKVIYILFKRFERSGCVSVYVGL